MGQLAACEEKLAGSDTVVLLPPVSSQLCDIEEALLHCSGPPSMNDVNGVVDEQLSVDDEALLRRYSDITPLV